MGSVANVPVSSAELNPDRHIDVARGAPEHQFTIDDTGNAAVHPQQRRCDIGSNIATFISRHKIGVVITLTTLGMFELMFGIPGAAIASPHEHRWVPNNSTGVPGNSTFPGNSTQPGNGSVSVDTGKVNPFYVAGVVLTVFGALSWTAAAVIGCCVPNRPRARSNASE